MKHSSEDERLRGHDHQDAGETIAADHLPHDSQVAGTTHAKACCMCGVNLSGERRYKDTAGRYWCCDCAKADSMAKHPAACPDCGQPVLSAELVEYEGSRVCKDCAAKRQAAQRRAAARQAAAEEESREQQQRYHRLILGVSVLAGLAVLYMILRLFVL